MGRRLKAFCLFLDVHVVSPDWTLESTKNMSFLCSGGCLRIKWCEMLFGAPA